VTLDRSGFAVGTGRCGTKFISKLFEEEPQIASCHERNNFNETFHRYCVWNNLRVDHEGFLQTKEEEISNDLITNDFSFEASAYLSLSIVHLYKRFASKFILLTRDPVDMVNSYYSGKNMYEMECQKQDSRLAVGYHGKMRPHHFLGRIVPNGKEFLRWKELTRVGRLAWMWNTINLRVIEQFRQIPRGNSMIMRLEDFGYQKFPEIGRFFGISPSLSAKQFQAIADSRVNAFKVEKRTIGDWSEREVSDFVEQTREGIKALGYGAVVERHLMECSAHASPALEEKKGRRTLSKTFMGLRSKLLK